jgi:hypothetical protein
MTVNETGNMGGAGQRKKDNQPTSNLPMESQSPIDLYLILERLAPNFLEQLNKNQNGGEEVDYPIFILGIYH